ncbi:hypothetical protein IQ37_07520 [Chryseobacterium piperi]|uniref:Uncharacterized protein n=1 Tax=Chryseobacterium piperi TaxID=558152 RepID=A0A086BJQ4_9FLAO|nr:hypothetical protein IQ37_07520 [Chryseobacterium piperi]
MFSYLLSAQKTSDSIDIFLKNKMEELKIPGLQLAVIRNGKTEKISNYGFANIEHQSPIKINTVFYNEQSNSNTIILDFHFVNL